MTSDMSCRFAAILSNIGWPPKREQDPIDLIGVTGCAPKQGVSTIATQVAIAAAKTFEKRTLLVDCNFAHSSLHQMIGGSEGPGLAELIETGDLQEQSFQDTRLTKLRLLAAGTPGQREAWPLIAVRNSFRSLIADHELVICDIPPVETQSMSGTMLSFMDRVLLVVNAKAISQSQLTGCRRALRRRGVSISGVVMNRIQTEARNGRLV